VSAAKVAVTIDKDLLQEVDRWVEAGEFPSRSRVVQAGLHKLLDERLRHQSLLAELARLDPVEERQMAEEWLTGEVDWTRS
jgi:Arc/MetJ-type ribon-helix-helix transcriptional regulator